MSDKYELVSEAIYSLVPRLKELSVGCKLKHWCDTPVGEKEYDLVFINKDFEENMMFRVIGGEDEVHCEYQIKYFDNEVDDFASYEIIGHPITLEGVLEAFRVDYQIKLEISYAIDCIWLMTPNSGVFEWKCGKPLSEQSDETINFLASLLLEG